MAKIGFAPRKAAILKPRFYDCHGISVLDLMRSYVSLTDLPLTIKTINLKHKNVVSRIRLTLLKEGK